jgi:uncharacterized tellurite resistance protein B-like protein
VVRIKIVMPPEDREEVKRRIIEHLDEAQRNSLAGPTWKHAIATGIIDMIENKLIVEIPTQS